MPIMYCSTCSKPIPDSFHDFKGDVCKCRDWEARAKEKGYALAEQTIDLQEGEQTDKLGVEK